MENIQLTKEVERMTNIRLDIDLLEASLTGCIWSVGELVGIVNLLNDGEMPRWHIDDKMRSLNEVVMDLKNVIKIPRKYKSSRTLKRLVTKMITELLSDIKRKEGGLCMEKITELVGKYEDSLRKTEEEYGKLAASLIESVERIKSIDSTLIQEV